MAHAVKECLIAAAFNSASPWL